MSDISLRNAAVYAALEGPRTHYLRNVAVYAAISAPSALAIRQVAGFALEAQVPEFTIRQIVGYALEPEPNASFFTGRSGYEILKEAIHKECGFLVTPDLGTIGDPFLGGVGFYNSRVPVIPNPDSAYVGDVVIEYDRFHLSDALEGFDLTVMVGTASTVHGRLVDINEAYGIVLEPRDVVDGPIHPNATSFLLRPTDKSYLFLPGTDVMIGVPGNDLSVEIEFGDLAGFEPVDDLEAWIAVSDLNGFDPA